MGMKYTTAKWRYEYGNDTAGTDMGMTQRIKKTKRGMGKRGFYPLFTTLGVLFLIMVVSLSIQWQSSGDRDYAEHIDRLSWLRINGAASNVKSMASSSLTEQFYDAILEVGRIPKGETINPFLQYGKDEGWNKIVENITESVASRFNDIMPSLADRVDSTQSIFVFENGINVTIGQLGPQNLRLVEAGDDITAVVEMPMFFTNNYNGWATTVLESNMTIPLNVRLKDIYGRAWQFNSEYRNTAAWTLTLALYFRAYTTAYNRDSEGPFLKEGHFSLDPIATILFGDLDTIKNLSQDIGSVLDTGAIPLATWFAEWKYLSEPSFLPAGFDLQSEDASRAREAISGNYNIEQAQDDACSGLPRDESKDCKLLFDSDSLDDKIDDIKDLSETYSDMVDSIEDWLGDYDVPGYLDCEDICEVNHPCDAKYQKCTTECETEYTTCSQDCKTASCKNRCKNDRQDCRRRCRNRRDTCEENFEECQEGTAEEGCRRGVLLEMFPDSTPACDEFRDVTLEIISELNEELNELDGSSCSDSLEYVDNTYVDGLNTDSKIEQNFNSNNISYGLADTEPYCHDSSGALSGLRTIASRQLAKDDLSDSMCAGSTKGDCEDLYNNCNDEDYCRSCKYPSCPSDGGSYECTGDLDAQLADRRDICKDCENGKCDEDTFLIHQCKCRCKPKISLVISVYEKFDNLLDSLKKLVDSLERTADNLKSQREAMQKAEQLSEQAERLVPQELGFDVFSRIDTSRVMYDQGEGLGGKACYVTPNFKDSYNGVCGDAVESTIMYTVQVAAASLATMFSAGATEELLRYALDTFPMIYETEVSYNLTETLIDDGNRVILKNVAGDGGDLYTYAPFEFEIYRDREFDINSQTLGRTFVYVYLPAIGGLINGMQRVTDGLHHNDCKGDPCS